MLTTLEKARQSRHGTLHLTDNCVRVLEHRYLKKGPDGRLLETPEDLFRRVARVVAEPEKLYNPRITEEELTRIEQSFYEVMTSLRFVPNSPTLMNAGREMGMLSACFVLPVEDSIQGIFDSIKNTALIQKAGGGTGFDFSRLRPNGDFVNSSGGTTSGPLSFLQVFSKATDAIQQGAFRRGANMGMMRIDHPDIIDFIRIKEDLAKLTNYNLSVSVTDDFMGKVKSNPKTLHHVVNPRTGKSFPLEKRDKAGEFWTVGEVFDLIVGKAWESGEPGVIFIDRINEHNPTPQIGRIEATNPCGEQPLLPYEACNLGSINLSRFVKEENGDPTFDWEDLRAATRLTTRFLDNIIEANRYPLEEIDRMCKGNRKVGLGVMGFADALFKLGIRYDSAEGVEFGEKLMRFVNDESHRMSEDLARERGCFPNWKGSIWDTRYRRPMRNACTTTVAPTGTISIIANCSGGIEPLFSLAFHRNVLDGQRLVEVNEVFKKVAVEEGFYSDELIEKVAEKGSLSDIDEVPEHVKRVFVTARDITPEWHIRMQAAFQKHCDASISKTTNFPEEATPEDVRRIYTMAFEHGLKGVTVYRDGCRKNQPMALKKLEKKTSDERGKEKRLDPAVPPLPESVPPLRGGFISPIKLPEIMSCLRVRQFTPFGNMHIKVSVEPDTGVEREVFAQLGKGGDIANSDLEAICRLLSLYLRSGGALVLALKQLDGIGSSLSVPSKEGRIQSLGHGLAVGLQKYLRAKEQFGLRRLLLGEVDLRTMRLKQRADDSNGSHPGNGDGFKIHCPECHGVLAFEEGCVKCHLCGFSQC